MEISFDKISSTPKPFSVKLDGAVLEGKLTKIDFNTAKLEGELKGDIDVVCDRCGVNFKMPIDQPLNLELSQKQRQNKDNLDIIEFLNGTIDLDYILQSELDSIKSSYHYCKKCNDIEDFEVEI